MPARPSLYRNGAPPRFVRSGSKHLLRLDVAGNCAANVLMNISDLQKLTDWLIDGARSAASPPRMMAETGERMVQAGLPLWRGARATPAAAAATFPGQLPMCVDGGVIARRSSSV